MINGTRVYMLSGLRFQVEPTMDERAAGRVTDRLPELLEEAPGIFNWALEGLDRLIERGAFVQPQASKSAIVHMEDLASPVSAFIRDNCIIDPDARVSKDEVWAAWKEWSEDAGIRKGSKDVLLKDLRAVDPRITRSGR